MRSLSTVIFVALPVFVLGCSGTVDDSATDPADDTGTSSESGGDETTPGEDTSSSDAEVVDEGSALDTEGDGTVPPAGATQANLKVAFIGDQGASSNTIAVLRQIKSEGAQFVVILGDFDYQSDPDKFDTNLTTGLGADFPVFAAAGNHDVDAWPEYKKRLETRLAKVAGAKCTGDYGNKMSCNYLGLFFVLSGIGTMGDRTSHEAYIKDQLTTDKSIWRVCAWHKNQHDMQIGGKSDEVGWTAYQLCQNNGALVMTGHEHSYSRTKTLNAVGDKTKGHGAVGEFNRLVVKAGAPGNTFVTVSGLGGVDIRDYEATSHADDTWWASWYAINGHLKNGTRLSTASGSGVGYGATFVTFNVDGDPKKARGYFKNLKGVEIDSFEIRRE
jgi:predicted phosphodiesterase